MLKVAVTGNIGSGKSSVCKVFEVLGIPVFYADRQAKELYKDPELLQIISDKLGPSVLNNDHTLNKEALASIIFNDKQALAFINGLIHPRVFEVFEQWTRQHKNKKYCMAEAALIFESGSYRNYDKIIVVHAPEKELLQRVSHRDGISKQQAQIRLDNQLSQSFKLKNADFTLLNDNNSLLIPAILKIHHKIGDAARYV